MLVARITLPRVQYAMPGVTVITVRCTIVGLPVFSDISCATIVDEALKTSASELLLPSAQNNKLDRSTLYSATAN